MHFKLKISRFWEKQWLPGHNDWYSYFAHVALDKSRIIEAALEILNSFIKIRLSKLFISLSFI